MVGRKAGILAIFFITNHNVPYHMDDSRKDVHPQKDRRVVTRKIIMLTSRNIEILPENDPYHRTPNP